MITVQILTKNNEKTIRKTLESIEGLGPIIIGDLGSSDSTLEICSSFKADIIKLQWKNNYSEARNELVRDGVNFYIEPWEVLIAGKEIIAELNDSRVMVIENKIMTKELRIWKNKKFQNPVFESIPGKADLENRVALISNGRPDRREENILIAKNWLDKNPTSSEAYYYISCAYLAARRYEEFLKFSGKYLAMDDNSGPAGSMIRYYTGIVEFHLGKINSASSNILCCLAWHPTFAELWCVLGDMYYSKGKYRKSKYMYKNALSMGKKRLKDDEYPVEILKYKEYPEFMIKNIEAMQNNKN